MAAVDPTHVFANIYAWYRFVGGDPKSLMSCLLRHLVVDDEGKLRPFAEVSPRYETDEAVKFRRKRKEERTEYGYAAREQAIWIHKDQVRRWAEHVGYKKGTESKPGQADRVFRDGKTFHRATVAFANDETAYAAWEQGKVSLDTFSRVADEEAFWEAVMPAEEDFQILGTVAVGVDRDIVWIGLTHDLSIVLEPDESIRARRIQQVITPVCLSKHARSRWVDAAQVERDVLARPALFQGFARMLVRTALPQDWEATRKTAREGRKETPIDFVRKAKFDDYSRRNVAFWYATRAEVANEEALFVGMRKVVLALGAKQSPEWIVLCVPLSFDDVARLVRRVLGSWKDLRIRFLVLDPDGLARLVGPFPWLWSAYIGPTEWAVLAPGDVSRLCGVLHLTPGLTTHLPLDRQVIHPAVDPNSYRHSQSAEIFAAMWRDRGRPADVPPLRARAEQVAAETPSFPPGQHTRIVGRRGSGKTTVICQLARLHYANRPTIVVARSCAVAQLPAIEAVLDALSGDAHQPILIVMDDVGEDSMILPLVVAAVARAESRGHRPTLVIAHDSFAGIEIDKALAGTLRGYVNRTLVLDAVPSAFLAEIAIRVLPIFQIGAAEDWFDEELDYILDFNDTPDTIWRWFYFYRGQDYITLWHAGQHRGAFADRVESPPSWIRTAQEAVQRLARRPGSADQLTLLLVLGSLTMFSPTAERTTALVQEAFGFITGTTGLVSRFEAARRALDGIWFWCDKNGRFHSPRSLLNERTLQLWKPSQEFSPFLVEFLRWTTRTTALSEDEQLGAVCMLHMMLLMGPKTPQAEAIEQDVRAALNERSWLFLLQGQRSRKW
jgi:hypothetical protein